MIKSPTYGANLLLQDLDLKISIGSHKAAYTSDLHEYPYKTDVD